jgi:hypothetical protein
MRETIIPTRETIVPERETIVPGRETTLARGVGIDDSAHTHVPTRRSFVVTGLGSDVSDQTQRGQGESFDPAGRGRVGRGSLFDPRRVAIVPSRRRFDPRHVAIDPRRSGTVGRLEFFTRRPCSFAPSPRLTAPTGHTQEVKLKATRKARGTMSKKEKAKLKGSVDPTIAATLARGAAGEPQVAPIATGAPAVGVPAAGGHPLAAGEGHTG